MCCAYQCELDVISSQWSFCGSETTNIFTKYILKSESNPAEISGSNSHVWGVTDEVIKGSVYHNFLLPSSHLLHFPAPPPSPCLTAPLFLFPSANKLCMPSPTHGVVHCCTICSKLLLSRFCISLLASQSSCFPLSLLISLLRSLFAHPSPTNKNLTQPPHLVQLCTAPVSFTRTGSSFPEFLAAQLHPRGFTSVLCQLP